MEDEILKTLKMKAVGYTRDEVSEEYSVSESGSLDLTKKKITKKFYPPDSTALRDYLTITKERDVRTMSDEELADERKRLMNELAEILKEQNKQHNLEQIETEIQKDIQEDL